MAGSLWDVHIGAGRDLGSGYTVTTVGEGLPGGDEAEAGRQGQSREARDHLVQGPQGLETVRVEA
jgi:hypothetical protein